MNFNGRMKNQAVSAQSSIPHLQQAGGDLQAVSSVGGAEEDRTPDPLLAKQVLSQLSYSPMFSEGTDEWWAWVDSNYRPHPYQGCALTN